MKLAKVVFVFLLICVTALWALVWTPTLDLLPKWLQQLMFGFGGMLTVVLPVLWVFLAIVWRRRNADDR